MENIIEIIRARDLNALKAFLAEYPRGLDVETEDGAWALQEVMRQGCLEMAKFVVEYGIVNLNLIDREGNTVLHYGVESGNLELIKYLVERVDSPIAQANLKGETPFDRAQRLGQKEILRYFEEKLGVSAEEMYHNPIRRGMHPDPSIVRVGRDYYMVNSSFVFFPCIPVSHSRDLIHWKVIGYAITNPEWAKLNGLEGGRGYWAPDISYYEGRFYITATYRLNEGGMPQRLQMVTSSDKPEGPYCEPVFLDEEGIDPSIFTDLDGRRYMLLNRGARIFEISGDGRRILSEPRLLWYGENKKASEGPHMLYKDGYYYLFMAEGGTGMGHRITVARSRTLMGVYEACPYNPILRQWDEKRQLQCCGHGMPVETPEGDWYMVYLCNRRGTAGYAVLGRETALDPITWTADGWPLVNSLRGPSDLQRKPAFAAAAEAQAEPQEGCLAADCGRYEAAQKAPGAVTPEKESAARSAGSAPSFDPESGIWDGWAAIRGFAPGTFLADGETLCIRGNGRDLNTLGYNSLLLQHQRTFCFELRCRVQTETQKEADWDAGLTCYYDENSYLKLALCMRCGKPGILAAEYVDDRYVTDTFLPLEEQPLAEVPQTDGAAPGGNEKGLSVELKIVTENLKRSLYFKGKHDTWQQAAVFEGTSYLSSEGLKKGKRFTGAAAGVYVNGNVTGRFSDFAMEDM